MQERHLYISSISIFVRDIVVIMDCNLTTSKRPLCFLTVMVHVSIAMPFPHWLNMWFNEELTSFITTSHFQYSEEIPTPWCLSIHSTKSSMKNSRWIMNQVCQQTCYCELTISGYSQFVKTNSHTTLHQVKHLKGVKLVLSKRFTMNQPWYRS